MTTYGSVEQRIIHSYPDTYPQFHPCAALCEQGQRELYDFLQRLYTRLFEQPELLFSTLHPDGVFTHRFNKASDKLPELDRNMRVAAKTVDGLIEALMSLAGGELRGNELFLPKDIKLSARLKTILAELGLPAQKAEGGIILRLPSAEFFEALKYLAGCGAARFSRAAFDADYPYAVEVYARLMGEPEAFRLLETYWQERGYLRENGRDGKFNLDYYRDYGKRPTPLKAPWAERDHAGIALQYDYFVEDSAFLSLRIPSWRQLIERMASMDAELLDFVMSKAQRCSGCGYCIQTDKSEKPVLKNVTVEYEGKSCKLCPFFPGYSFVFVRLDMETARLITRFMGWIELELS